MSARRAANPAASITPEGGTGQTGHKWGRTLGLGRAVCLWVGVKVPTLCTQNQYQHNRLLLDWVVVQVSLPRTYKEATAALLSSGWFVRHPLGLCGELCRAVYSILPVEMFRCL